MPRRARPNIPAVEGIAPSAPGEWGPAGLSEALSAVTIRITDERGSDAYRGHVPKLPALASDTLRRGQVRRMCAELRATLRAGRYAPVPSYQTQVPKRAGGWRRLALLTPQDRILYEALVGAMGPSLERALASRDVLFGPRGTDTALRWSSFLRTPLRPASAAYAVSADVADLGTSLSRSQIEEALLRTGAERARVRAIGAFLDGVMQNKPGIPADLGASQRLATAVLARVDRDMDDPRWQYARCSDDFRIAVRTESEAEEALQRLAASLQAVGLELRPSRTEVVPVREYRDAAGLGASDWWWEAASSRFDGRLLHSGPARRARVGLRRLRATPAGRQQALEAVGDGLAERAALERGGLEPDLRAALELLITARDPGLLDLAEPVIARCPTLTPLVAAYLRAMLGTPARRTASQVISQLLAAEPTAFRGAWLCRAGLPAAAELDDAVVASLCRATGDATADWTLRTEAARVLAARGELTAHTRRRLARQAPPQFAGEVDLLGLHPIGVLAG
jgi:hypothetical protein